MDGRVISASQAQAMYLQNRPTLWYLSKLEARMVERGFPRDDKLYIRVVEAHQRLKSLCDDLRFVACGMATWNGHTPRIKLAIANRFRGNERRQDG